MKMMDEFEEFRKHGMEIMEEALVRIWELAEGRNLKELDTKLREDSGEIYRKLMGMALSAKGGKGCYGDTVKCACGGTAEFRQHRTRKLETILAGKDVEVKAAYYLCRECRKAIIPLLTEMGIGSDGVTLSLQELAVMAGTVEPYEEASSTLLQKMSGINMCSSRIQTMTVSEGEAMSEYIEEDRIECDEQLIHVEIDGGMVHVDDRWQEVKLGVIYGSDSPTDISSGRTKLMKKDFVAVRGGPGELAMRIDSCLPLDVAAKTVVVLGDGAKWIWNFAEEQFPDRIEILDYYHAMEHLCNCAAVLFGEGSKEAGIWVDEQRESLMSDNVHEIITRLESLYRILRAPLKRKAVASLIGYLQNNAHRMRYKTFIDAGLRIGSGAVESAVKHLIQQRMKRPGMRWHAKGADSIINLRCLFRSTGKWSKYWSRKKSLSIAA